MVKVTSRLDVGEAVFGMRACLDNEDSEFWIGICKTTGDNASRGSSCTRERSARSKYEKDSSTPPAKIISYFCGAEDIGRRSGK